MTLIRVSEIWDVTKDLHKKKIPALFIKLGISKVFETVNWSYLLDIMSFLGFGNNWKDWLSTLWGTSSSSFLLNGEPGPRLRHCTEGETWGPPVPNDLPLSNGASSQIV
jgi:hypothetical protein